MLSGVHVAKITTSISSGFKPAQAIACLPAISAISDVFTWLNLRSFTPVLC